MRAKTMFSDARVRGRHLRTKNGRARPRHIHWVLTTTLALAAGCVSNASQALADRDAASVVANAGQLLTALSTARGGDEIRLRPGRYGDIEIENLKFETTVRIGSFDPRNPAIFASIRLRNLSNVTLDGVRVEHRPSRSTTRWTKAVSAENVTGFSLTNSRVVGGLAVNGVPKSARRGNLDETGNVIGLPTGIAVAVRNATKTDLSGNHISSFHRGVTLSDVRDVRIVGNTIEDLRTTPIAGASIFDLLVDGNHFHSSRPWRLGGRGDHADFIHIWTDPKRQRSAGSNYTIRNNIFAKGRGSDRFLGIYLDDNANGLGFRDVLIENNMIHIGNAGAIRLENGSDTVIRNNTLLQSNDLDHRSAASVLLLDGSRRMRVVDNILGSVRISGDSEESSIVRKGNLVVQRQSPTSEHFYDDLFINARSREPSLADLQAIPGGLIEKRGVGARLTRFDYHPEKLTPVIRKEKDRANRTRFRFDSRWSADKKGFLAGDRDVAVHWDFGDGRTATGPVVSHRYEQPGVYDVVLSVVASGEAAKSHATVIVEAPTLLHVVFGPDGPRDVSDYASRFFVGKGGYAFDRMGGRRAFRVAGKESVRTRALETRQIFELENFGIALSIRRGRGGGPGRIMFVHRSWSMSLDKYGELNFTYTNRDGKTQTVRTRGARISDTEWHDVDFVFDAGSATASFTVDGRDVGRGDISGGLKVPEHWGLSFGNPWGDGFKGYIGETIIRAL